MKQRKICDPLLATMPAIKRCSPLRCMYMGIPLMLIVFVTTRQPILRQPVVQNDLPPLLSTVTAHHSRPAVLPASRPEWKRPRVLTAHATRHVQSKTVDLAIFTTGTDTQSYGRKFHVVACQVGERVYRAALSRPEVTICEVDVPSEGESVTVLLRLDEALRTAMSKDVELAQEVFKIELGDVVPVNVSVKGESAVAAIASDLRWTDGLVDFVDTTRPRYELCLMTAMKQYPYLLEDFVEYYRRAGVDQVFIYDNFASTDLKSFMSKYDFVQVIFWPWTRSQMQSFTHFLRAARARCKYVVFFDADEYIMIGISGTDVLRKYVKHRINQGYKQVISHFVRFLNNGYIRRPHGPLPELYTRREKDQKVVLGKSIIDVDHKFQFHKIHVVEGLATKTYWNSTLELNPTSPDHNAMLMHYTDRSWEENVLKKRYGGSSPMTTYRKPEELDLDNPEKKYMDLEKTVPFDGFLQRYRDVMRVAKPLEDVLVWQEGDRWCKRKVCKSCWTQTHSGPVCNKGKYLNF